MTLRRPYNFSPGPATLPQSVLETAAAEFLNWQNTGMSVVEMSHRGAAFTSIYEETEARVRRVLALPAHFKVLFMQGGAIAQNALVPLNLAGRSQNRVLDYLITGSWSKKSEQEAQRYGQVALVASSEAQGYTHIPAPSAWNLSQNAAYVHLCSNETVHGVEFHELPHLAALGSGAPLVIDCSSHIASRPMDWSRVGLAYAGAQKNLGIAGLTLVFIREDLLGLADKACPSAFNYKVVAENTSMYNTPPTFAIYITNLVFQWLEAQGGILAIEEINIAKAEMLYKAIDASVLYYNRVHPSCRSRMNVPFFLRDEALNAPFLAGAQERGLLQLKGHKMVGGMRASLYNAMPLEGVKALVGFMREFEKTHG